MISLFRGDFQGGAGCFSGYFFRFPCLRLEISFGVPLLPAVLPTEQNPKQAFRPPFHPKKAPKSPKTDGTPRFLPTKK